MSTIETLNATHLRDYLASPEGIHEMFARLGYDTYAPEPINVDDLELNEADAPYVNQVYIVNNGDFGHTVWLYEVADVRLVRLRGLAYDALQRGGTHLLAVTTDYKEVVFAHPYFAGGTAKSHVRVNRLKIITSDPTRHDVDTLNALHAHRRTAAEVYAAQNDAFNVTRTTRKFYDEYRRHFERAREMVVTYNKGIPEFQNAAYRNKLHAYTQRLLGRLMFLYFLQRKGWLGGQKDFLTRRYHETLKQHASDISYGETFHYYQDVLEPLFFETLNTRREGNWTRWKGVAIPYLNGGLFDRGRDPDGIIILPDSLFDPNSAEGILAFFNRYNFTVADDTPLEQDVAVDPEMLGKVFENMLEEEDRGQSGSFYTPRTIVAYMCQEALAGYLEESARIPREETRQHFDPDALINFSEGQAGRVEKALDTLTVLDPAVGSGSFLIGMMQEIITLRRAVAAALHQHVTPNVLADWKEAIIRDTLYGVDIKAEAIEIAQLRLWLSLVVNQSLEQAHPLPNLDYKLMAGNSLIETIDGEPVLSASAQAMIGGAAQPEQPTLFEMGAAAAEARKLDDLRKEYFHAAPEARKQLAADIRFQERRIIEAGLDDLLETVNQRITQIERKYKELQPGAWKTADAKRYAALVAQQDRLERIKSDLGNKESTLPFFLYRLHFSEVFKRKGGFDVVVANPPYVRQELISDQKPELEVAYPAVYAGTADLYVYFFARSFSLLNPKGHLSFITPNKFMRANYGKKLRGYLAEKVRLQTLIDFGDLPIFDATTYPMITLAGKQPVGGHQINILQITTLDEAENLHAAAGQAFRLPKSALTDEGWQLSNPRVRAVMDKLKVAGKPLGEYVNGKFYSGIKTGFNEAFVIDEETREELLAADPNSADVIKPYLRGRDIKRWNADWSHLYMLYIAWDFEPEQYPAVYQHLKAFKDKLSARPEVRQSRHAWFAMSRYGAEYVYEFSKPKIVYPDIASRPEFAFDTRQSFIVNTCYTIPIEGSIYPLGILNSKAVLFFYQNTSSTIRGGYYRFIAQYMEQVPIPNPPDDLRGRIAALAQQCLDAAQDAPDTLPTLEAELNALVYQAYGLDEDDIAVIEGSLGGHPPDVSQTEVDEP